MFKTTEEALSYLRNCNKIILPDNFTYWSHSSQFLTDENLTLNETKKKAWKNLPTDNFITNNVLSLRSMKQRLNCAYEKDSFDGVPLTYGAESKHTKNFQIKFVIPHCDLSQQDFEYLGKDQKYIQALKSAHDADYRHPKIASQTLIHIFAYMDHDEMNPQNIDTLFAVRDEDLIVYANEVQKEIEKLAHLGKIKNSSYTLPTSYASNDHLNQTFVIGDNLYKKKILKTTTPKSQPEEKQEPYNMVELKSMLDKELSNTSNHPFENISTVEETTIPDLIIKEKEDLLEKANAKTSFNFGDQYRFVKSIYINGQKFSDNIKELLKNKSGNYLQYALNDFYHLACYDSVRQQAEDRLKDLELYTTNVRPLFIYSGTEQKTTKKSGILGLVGMKEKYNASRRLTPKELQQNKNEDLKIINISLAEGRLDEDSYEDTLEAINRLYSAYAKQLELEEQKLNKWRAEQDQRSC